MQIDPVTQRPRLTARQQQVLDFINETIDGTGSSPTIREIGEAIGVKSTNGISYHISRLEHKGYITREDRKSRTCVPLVKRDGSLVPTSTALEVRSSNAKDRLRLSPRQEVVFDLIVATIRTKGHPPTLREIGSAMGISSTKGVSDHLFRLEKKGYIKRRPGQMRNIIAIVDKEMNGEPEESSADEQFLGEGPEVVIGVDGLELHAPAEIPFVMLP